MAVVYTNFYNGAFYNGGFFGPGVDSQTGGGGGSTFLRRPRRAKRLRYWWEKDEPEKLDLQSLTKEEALLPPIEVEALYIEKASLDEYRTELIAQRASEVVVAKLAQIDAFVRQRIADAEKYVVRSKRIAKKKESIRKIREQTKSELSARKVALATELRAIASDFYTSIQAERKSMLAAEEKLRQEIKSGKPDFKNDVMDTGSKEAIEKIVKRTSPIIEQITADREIVLVYDKSGEPVKSISRVKKVRTK